MANIGMDLYLAYENGYEAGKKNATQKWISVKERLPEDGKYVLAYSADDDFMTVEARHHFGVFQITHWMQLPEPPEEGGGEDG